MLFPHFALSLVVSGVRKGSESKTHWRSGWNVLSSAVFGGTRRHFGNTPGLMTEAEPEGSAASSRPALRIVSGKHTSARGSWRQPQNSLIGFYPPHIIGRSSWGLQWEGTLAAGCGNCRHAGTSAASSTVLRAPRPRRGIHCSPRAVPNAPFGGFIASKPAATATASICPAAEA